MAHIVNGGVCLCVSCIRERNEANEALNRDLYNQFKLKIANGPPMAIKRRVCQCGWCMVDPNWLEGCLRPTDPDYTKIEGRAASLLREMTTDRQWECWMNEDYIPVYSNKNEEFRIYRMPTYNTYDVRGDQWLCTLPQTERWGGGSVLVPPSDGRVAQMLMIMTDIDKFIKTANISKECQHPYNWKIPEFRTVTGTGRARRYGRQLHLANRRYYER